MNKADYPGIINREATRFAEVARQHRQPPILQIPSCPAWNLTDLLLHLGGGHRFVIKNIRERNAENAGGGRQDASFLNLSPAWAEWAKTGHAPADQALPAELIEWFEDGATQLETTLNEVEPDTQVWNWAGTDRTKAEIYFRQMAIETSIHRWDAQNAQPDSTPDPIDPELARDGIDLLLQFLPLRRQRIKEPPGKGESYHFHRTDGAGEWLVKFNGSEVDIKEEHAKGDVAIRGSASDLLLFFWGRIAPEQLEVFGDSNLVKHYFELVPPM